VTLTDASHFFFAFWGREKQHPRAPRRSGGARLAGTVLRANRPFPDEILPNLFPRFPHFSSLSIAIGNFSLYNNDENRQILTEGERGTAMTVILYNPKAQSGTGEEQTRQWVKAHGETEADMKNLLEIEDMGAYVASLTPVDRLILCGGDGTLTRFADAIRSFEVKVPIYFAAVGTGNDFLRDLRYSGIQEDPIQINRYLEDLPVVYVRGKEHAFVNGIGYGIDGYCCEEGDRLRTLSEKPVNYSAIAIRGLLGKFKARSATITVDGQTKTYQKVWLAPTMNGRYYGGGLMITPAQDRLNADRSVSVAVLYHSGKLKTLLVFPSISHGKHVKHTEMFEVREGQEVTVRFDTPCALQIDGETVLGVTEYTVRSAPRAAAYAKERKAEAEKAKAPRNSRKAPATAANAEEKSETVKAAEEPQTV
jgi:diacylglycerol kinase family enzyme